MTFDEAEKLAMETDYAWAAVGQEINVGDAGAFFLEGYKHAMKLTLPQIYYLIDNDAFACTFQTVGQYRTKVKEEILKIITTKP
jgi:hypothetical protein